MTTFVIESGIPLHNRTAGVRNSCKYPFREMEIGDSFFVPAEEITVRKLVQRMSTAVSRAARNTGCKFAVRSDDAGVRVWRVQ